MSAIKISHCLRPYRILHDAHLVRFVPSSQCPVRLISNPHKCGSPRSAFVGALGSSRPYMLTPCRRIWPHSTASSRHKNSATTRSKAASGMATLIIRVSCTHPLASADERRSLRTNPPPDDWSYCETDNMLYIHHNGGGLASMAIDVDGKRPKGDNPQDSQDGTAFEGILKRYNISGVTDLDPYIHPYVVFGNQGTKKGYTTFHPRMYDIQPLSVMAVVCADKLVRAGLETEVLLPVNLLTRIRANRSSGFGATPTATTTGPPSTASAKPRKPWDPRASATPSMPATGTLATTCCSSPSRAQRLSLGPAGLDGPRLPTKSLRRALRDLGIGCWLRLGWRGAATGLRVRLHLQLRLLRAAADLLRRHRLHHQLELLQAAHLRLRLLHQPKLVQAAHRAMDIVQQRCLLCWRLCSVSCSKRVNGCSIGVYEHQSTDRVKCPIGS